MDELAHSHHHHHPSPGSTCDAGHSPAATVKDPVCGMSVNPAKTPHRTDLDGVAHVFCSAGCKGKFVADPKRYLEPAPRAQAPADPDALYTCPMHAEVRQTGPGACPICGMALEPMLVSAEAGPNPELIDMTRRLWIGGALAIPVVGLAMAGDVADLSGLVSPWASNWIQLGLAVPIVVWAGWPFWVRGWQSLVTRHLNMFTLIAIGTGVAMAYSVVATAAPGLFPEGVRQADGTVGVYFEAAAVIVVLVLVGQVLELRARETTGGAIRGLLDLAPKSARRVSADGSEQDIPIEALVPGDRFRVRPGEQVATDGLVVDGRGLLDQAMVTGEAMPVSRSAGDTVIGGTVNQTGSFVVEARRVGRDTLLAQIVQLVSEAQRSRAPIQRLADRVAGLFVPAVLAAAALTFVVWMALGPQPRLAHAMIAAVSVLIIACPCALGLATPMSIMVGVGRGARAGVLVRDAGALERLERVDTLVIDKTGTLTEGRPSVVALAPAAGVAAMDMLRLVAGVERASEHPLGRAIVEEADRRGLSPSRVEAFTAVPGQGASGRVDGQEVAVGRAAYLSDVGIDTAALATDAEALRREGATVVFAAVDGRLAGTIGIADPVKPSAHGVLAELKRLGLTIVMLTGDHHQTAEAVGRGLGLSEIEAEVLPDQKAKVVERLKRDGRTVAMAGDGVNDAPALAAADVGIAMGTGTDIAMQSAGIILLDGDLAGLLRARRLSAATLSNIRQNLLFAFAYNAVGIPVAAGILYPAFGLLLSPMLAAGAMALSSISVIANALRLRHADLG